MNKKIKAVVFDVGGVLCEWEGIVKEYGAETALPYPEFYRLFLRLSFNPDNGSDLGLMSMDEFFKQLAAAAGVPEKSHDWRRRFVPGFKRIEPAYQLLEELKGKYRLAVLTNAKTGLWDEWREGRLRNHFELIVDSSEVGVLKPDGRIYRILLNRLGLAAQACLYLDDFPEYTAAARKLGFKTVTFADPEESAAKVRKFLELS